MNLTVLTVLGSEVELISVESWEVVEGAEEGSAACLDEGFECARGIEGKLSNCEPDTDMFVQLSKCVSFIVMSCVNVWCNTTCSGKLRDWRK